MTDTTNPGDDDGLERMDRPNQEVVREPDSDPTNVGEPDDTDDDETTDPPPVDPPVAPVVDPVAGEDDDGTE